MLYKIEKKLLNFYTNGNSAEDFFAARRIKTAKFRKVIRVCFYLHCIAALACIIMSIAFSAGFDIIKISVCALTAVVFAFFAVGDLEHVKTISCVMDFAFAAGAFVTASFGAHRTLYLICGIIMCILGISMIVSAAAAACKRFLENASPFMIRRESSTSPTDDFDDIPDLPDEYKINLLMAPESPLPPPVSKMRELADQVCKIICGENDKDRS